MANGGDHVIAPEIFSALIQDISELLAFSNGQREVLAAALRSVLAAMARVPPDAREELQALVDAFIEDPEDKDAKAKIGALLLAARQSDH